MAAGEQVSITIVANDKASKVIAGITRSFDMLADGITKLTREFVDYGDEVKRVSAFTGMTVDETSRLIQTADDAFVSYETVTMALRTMADRGITPSTQKMMQLSDAYRNIQDPLARSTFLLDTFGRSGLEMAKLMELGGEKIKAMSENVKEGQIITDEKLANIYAGKQALDEFNDSLESIKFEIAAELLKIFKDLPKPIQDTVLALGLIGQSGVIDNLSNLAIIMRSLSGAQGIAGLGTAAGAATGPVTTFFGITTAAAVPMMALAAAVGLLLLTINKYGPAAYESLKKLGWIIKWGFMSNEAARADVEKNFPASRQHGGEVFKSRPYLVGETGPELFVPSGGGNIIPNSRIGGGGGSVFVTINGVIGIGDREHVAESLKPYLKLALRGA